MSTRWLLMSVGALALSVAADLALFSGESHGDYGDFWWSGIAGFFAVFGFVGCLAIILVGKGLGRYWLQRGEDYYGPGDRDG